MLLVRRHQEGVGVQELELLDAEPRASTGAFTTEALRLTFSTRTAGSPHLRVGNSRMPEYQCQPANPGSDEHGTATPSGMQLRLARALADMVTGAATFRVSQRDPGQQWPSPSACAHDEYGQPVPATRVQRLIAARWIIRAHPSISWIEPHDFDLRTAMLTPTVWSERAIGEVS